MSNEFEPDKGLQSDSPFEVARLDSEKMRSAVAAKLFGGEAAPVRIGPYTVLRRLGSGGMGVVYAAFDERLDRKIAVKVMHGRAVQKVQENRLRSEAKSLAQLSHPNVVAVYEVGSFRGQVFLAMEFLPGKTLAKLKRDPELAAADQLRPWVDAAKGLLAAHRAGIAHRDFKPANAMQLPDGQVKVFDFGLAIRVDAETGTSTTLSTSQVQSEDATPWHPSSTTNRDESSQSPQTKTMTGALVGTPAYMSPEQHRGQRPDARSDQFSFCVSVWEYWTGTLPFAGSNRAELLAAMETGSVVSIPRGSMPGWLRSTLIRGLSLRPEDRFASMHELIAQLERGMVQRRRRLWAGAAVVPLLFGAGLSAYGWSRPDPCDDLGAHWDELAPAQALADVGDKLSDERGGVAKDTFSQVVRDLTRYVEQGRSEHISACKEAMGSSKVGAAGFAVQSSCYLAASNAVSSYITRLSVAGQKELRPELWLSSRLPSLASCAEIAGQVAPVAQNSSRAAIEKELAQAQVDRAFFDYAKATVHAQSALKMAQAVEDRRLESRASLVLARSLKGQGKYDPARKAVDTAYRLAEQVDDAGLRLDAAVVRAALMLKQGHPQEASSQLRDAYPLAMRPDIDPERRLNYFAATCRAPREAFRLCEAHRNCVQGLSLMEDEPGSVPTRNRMYRRLAWLYREAGLFEKSLETSAKAQAELRAAVGSDSRLMLASELVHLTLSGESVNFNGKAVEDVEKLLPLARDLHARYQNTYGDKSAKVISVRTNYAELLRWAGHLDEAQPLFESLLRDHPDDPARYYALVAYGKLLIAQNKIAQGTKTLKEGLQLIEETRSRSQHSGDETKIPEQAEALFALAKVQGKTTRGRAMAKEALAVYTSLQAQAKRNREKRDCAELGPGVDEYQRQRQLVQAWLGDDAG